MFISGVYAATVALLSLRSFVSAFPLVTRAGQGTWNPPITAPKAGDVWTVGSTQTVTWDTKKIPPSAANRNGTLLLGYFDGPTEHENLDINHPLAYGFPLTGGSIRFKVPDVQTRDTYIVVLMGNSGNASPEFTIINHNPTSMRTHGSSHKANTQKDPNDFDPIDPNQLPPAFPTMPLPPLTPDPPFSDPKIDPIETEPLSKDAPAPVLCKERRPSSHSGSIPSPEHNSASHEDSNKRCRFV